MVNRLVACDYGRVHNNDVCENCGKKNKPIEKVFCKDCRYHEYIEFYLFLIEYKHKNICSHSVIKHMHDAFAGKPYKIKCFEINENFNCKDYKRKWWKFWV